MKPILPGTTAEATTRNKWISAFTYVQTGNLPGISLLSRITEDLMK